MKKPRVDPLAAPDGPAIRPVVVRRQQSRAAVLNPVQEIALVTGELQVGVSLSELGAVLQAEGG